MTDKQTTRTVSMVLPLKITIYRHQTGSKHNAHKPVAMYT